MRMMAKTTPQPLPLRSTTVVVGRSTTRSVTRSSAMLLSSRWTHLSAESDSHAKRIRLPERKKGAAQAAPLSSVRMISVADLRYGRGDRTSGVEGKSVSVRVDLGGCRFLKKQNTKIHKQNQ